MKNTKICADKVCVENPNKITVKTFAVIAGVTFGLGLLAHIINTNKKLAY